VNRGGPVRRGNAVVGGALGVDLHVREDAACSARRLAERVVQRWHGDVAVVLQSMRWGNNMLASFTEL
jgi:hypothetical protein